VALKVAGVLSTIVIAVDVVSCVFSTLVSSSADGTDAKEVFSASLGSVFVGISYFECVTVKCRKMSYFIYHSG
jgi:hypothetical protein